MSLISGQQATYRDIVAGLEDCGGVSRIYMWQLRDANKNDRLGVNVVSDIARELKRRGIGCVPDLSNQKQWDIVRIYLKQSSIGRIIESAARMDESADKILNNAAACAETMDRIKEIVAP